MTKRGVPGVWTGGFYDGWAPNYLFFIANTPQLDRPLLRDAELRAGATSESTLGATQTSREWYRPNPPLPQIKWGPRNNVNMQQSALLFALQYVAKNKETLLENYYLKNKRAVERGQGRGAVRLGDPRRAAAARRGGRSREPAAAAGGRGAHRERRRSRPARCRSAAGDYVVRMDQPYSMLVDALLGTQFFAPGNPNPYDDTGWTLPLLRNVKAHRGGRQGDPRPADDAAGRRRRRCRAAITGNGQRADRRAQRRQRARDVPLRQPDVKMLAAEAAVRGGRPQVRRRCLHHPERRTARGSRPSIKELGLSAYAVAAAPAGEDARAGDCRASATCTRGRARRTRAGCGWRSTS